MKKNQGWIQEFVDLIGKQNPLHFAALAQILKVEVNQEKGKTRPFPDIFQDVMERIGTLNRKQRRDLAKVLQDSALTKEELKERKTKLDKIEEKKEEETSGE